MKNATSRQTNIHNSYSKKGSSFLRQIKKYKQFLFFNLKMPAFDSIKQAFNKTGS